ncbi:MAG: mannose-6-phosphate isomerase [Candidatus Competibacteraceae bacterium]|nr:mannose-6-phosphate isomerase [Candidatus Competibacteraceae bacterium]
MLVVDCYVGVHTQMVLKQLSDHLQPSLTVSSGDGFLSPDTIDRLVEPYLGDNDPIFGFLCGLTMDRFLDPAKVTELRRRIDRQPSGLVLVVGEAASLIHSGDVLVYADMPRWEGQLRQRRDEVSNLGVVNRKLKASLQYKRSFFVDWRVADRHKKPLLDRAGYFLDTTDAKQPKLACGQSVRDALDAASRRPFRVVPFFDPGPWGGQWMRKVCDLEGYTKPEPPNYAWCFDCVPEENSLLLRFGQGNDALDVELPSVNLLYRHPRQLLGDPVHARFGDEFPIRFDLLDTMDGGHLSFQVHPLTEYVQERFGMHYTQDESYYLLDAAGDGCCYLGVKPGVDPAEFRAALDTAQAGGKPFDAERFANRFPARRHDHYLIPAGTVHCSGRNTMVLEISATPYIFTFKLWDWGRLGLDGRPRPINIERGMPNIQWDRDTEFCRRELVNAVQPIASGPGWREERTGLHRREFIETRRHWFTQPVEHHTGGVDRGGVHVLNLVQGTAAMIESPDRAFAPCELHFAETCIVPAVVGRYTIRPLGAGEHATLRASVRTGIEAPHV